MAKFVIAGSSDCPYYAKIEILGDQLSRNLPDFKLHKIVVEPHKWQSWLDNLCTENGWSHAKSPVTWRELIDRGGKGVLIGDANDFEEYAQAYYGIKSTLMSSDMTAIAAENLRSKQEEEEEEEEFHAQSNPISVCVSGAASGVAYGILNYIATGHCIGDDVEIALRLLDTEDKQQLLEGLRMEAFDLAYPLLRQVTATYDPKTAFADASVVVILDEVERSEEETKDEWLVRNSKHFVALAEIIDSVAKPDVKVIVSGKGPVNFNILMMQDNMSNVPPQNVVGVSRTLENHAKAIISQRLLVNSAGVVDIGVWGNINGSHVIDVTKARVYNYDGAIWGPPSFSVNVAEMLHDEKWISGEFVELVNKRTELLETTLNHRACMSEASAITSLLRHLCSGSPADQFFSLAVRVPQEGLYNIPGGLVSSMPVRFTKEGWTVVSDLEMTDEFKGQLNNAVIDLQEETYAVYPRPSTPTPEPIHPPAEPIIDEGQEPKPEDGTEETPVNAEPTTELTTGPTKGPRTDAGREYTFSTISEVTPEHETETLKENTLSPDHR